MRTVISKVLATFTALLITASATAQEADMVIYGGLIYTADDTDPIVEAVAITDGRFSYVGSRMGMGQYIGENTSEIDLAGTVLFPGFVDGHAHLDGIGERSLTFDVSGTKSIKHLQEQLSAWRKAHPDDMVIYARGWIETHWPEGRFPSRFDLDAVVSDIPVVLQRSDGHAAVANSLALQLANITGDTVPPAGGDILKNVLGEPTGMLIDKAADLVGFVQDAMPKPSRADLVIEGGRIYASRGWTGMHNMDVEWENVLAIEAASDAGLLKIRINNMVEAKAAQNLFNSGKRFLANGLVKTQGIKYYMDGALGSRGAALLEPYSDANSDGLITLDLNEVIPEMRYALQNGFQITTHAIGDRGNREALNNYEQVFESNGPAIDHRWRIEHAQHLNAIDINRFAKLDVLPSMQPSHAIGDLHFAPSRLGIARLVGAYAWKTLLNTGVIIVGGSDAPVEVGDPLIEFYAAVARRDLKGFQGDNWHSEEAVSREDALKMFTLWPAYAQFEEDNLGSITVGKKADLTAFSEDIMTIAQDKIPQAKAVLTIVDGKVIYVAE